VLATTPPSSQRTVSTIRRSVDWQGKEAGSPWRLPAETGDHGPAREQRQQHLGVASAARLLTWASPESSARALSGSFAPARRSIGPANSALAAPPGRYY
jgi:hypothetical protein